ncbi:MAG: tRNA pseudouridine(13) synthase TruD [Planctomycetaceae bacterium]|nr:tRNA pseudouridine(13) synthase TruD [Planctomycetaceae bacterium]
MKLKRLPEDFRVTELTDVVAGPKGGFSLYRLTKRGVGTPEAIDAILRRLKLPRHRVSYGGLKDRHAVTVQHLTIQRGPPRGMEQNGITLEYLGRCERAFTPADIRANGFEIVLRSLDADSLATAVAGVEDVRRDGVPNYFDDQRFGSIGPSGEFIGAAWIKGNYERCLWLALAEEHPFDRSDEKQEKRILRDSWGNFVECKRLLARSHRRSIVTFLADRPGDFRGAWARVNVDLRRLWLSAFQSELWNRLLAAQLRRDCAPAQLFDVQLKTQSVPFFRDLDEQARTMLQATELPLPSARLKLDEGPTRDLAEQVVRDAGLEWRELRVKYPRDSFFSKGSRSAVIVPQDMTAAGSSDDLHAGREKLSLRFVLPRGAYATIVVKRLMEDHG